MKKRMIVMVIAVLVFVAAIGAVKYRQIRGAMAQGASFRPPPESVTTTVVRQESWPSTVAAIGTVTAVQGVTVSADLPGIVEKISFESGRTVPKGALLVRLDTSQEEAQLRAAESKRNLARLYLERMRGLRESGVISQSDYDRAAAELTQNEAQVGEIRATIERKTIRAPFSGLLGIRQVNLGQYLNGGDPIVPLQSLRPVYATFAVPQQEMARLRAGAAVEVTARGAADLKATGRITAVDSVVDEATRNVQVQATFANAQGRLRPGMFVQAKVLMGGQREVVTLPASAINYAPYGDSVFIVEEVQGPKGDKYRGARQQVVKLGGALGDQVAVLSGLNEGDEVATSGVFKLRQGAVVRVDNAVLPANNPAPKPEDN
jgi:membrane fusion protein (multidrug efflux system)